MNHQRMKTHAPALIITLLLLFSSLPYTTYASESSGSGNLIQQKLDELKISIASRAAKIKEDLTKRLENKVLIGPVESSNDDRIQILADGEARNIITNDYTNLPKVKIVVGDYLIALGEIDDKNNLVARKVLVSNPPEELDRKIIWGQVLSVQKDLLKFRAKESTLSALLLNEETVISSASKELTLSDLKEGTVVVAIGVQKNDSLQTRFIDVLANKTIKLVKPPPASASATTSAIKKK